MKTDDLVTDNTAHLNAQKRRYEAPKIEDLGLSSTEGGFIPGFLEATTSGTVS